MHRNRTGTNPQDDFHMHTKTHGCIVSFVYAAKNQNWNQWSWKKSRRKSPSNPRSLHTGSPKLENLKTKKKQMSIEHKAENQFSYRPTLCSL